MVRAQYGMPPWVASARPPAPERGRRPATVPPPGKPGRRPSRSSPSGRPAGSRHRRPARPTPCARRPRGPGRSRPSTTSSTRCSRTIAGSSSSGRMGMPSGCSRRRAPAGGYGQRSGDLGGGEGDDPRLGVVAEDGVEVVEVAPTGAHDHHGPHGGSSPVAAARPRLGWAAGRREGPAPCQLVVDRLLGQGRAGHLTVAKVTAWTLLVCQRIHT